MELINLESMRITLLKNQSLVWRNERNRLNIRKNNIKSI